MLGSDSDWVNLFSIAYTSRVLRAKDLTFHTYHSLLFLDFLNPPYVEKSLKVYLLLPTCDSVKFKTYLLVPTVTVIDTIPVNQALVILSLFFRCNTELCVCMVFVGIWRRQLKSI